MTRFLAVIWQKIKLGNSRGFKNWRKFPNVDDTDDASVNATKPDSKETTFN